MRPLFTFAISAVLLLAACKTGNDVPQAETVNEPDTLFIEVVDTVGVLMGDSLLEFGNITDASFTPDGRLLVLDGLKARLVVLDGEGCVLETVGRAGSGPGEYQYPRSFALMSDGGMVISDWGSISTTILDGDLEFDTLINSYGSIPPDGIVPFPGGQYVGMSLEHSIVDDEPAGDTFLARFGRSEEPLHVYCSYPMRFSVDQDGDLNVHTVGMTWDTSAEGLLAVAQTCDSIWAFTVYSAQGAELFTVERDWEKVPKSEEELADGAYHESLTTSEETGNSMNRDRLYDDQPQYRNAISSVEIDDENRIWIGQGWTDHPSFEVYDLNGELLFTAVIPELEGAGGRGFCFDNGYLAYDTAPDDYPKVFVLDSDLQ